MEFLARLLDTSDFPARWWCGRWSAGHGWLHILSDLGVWSAYFAIPLVFAYFLIRRKDLPFRSIFLLFASFIVLCGTTHLMEAIIFWWPAYRLAGLIKLLTAVVSWITVLALVRVAPVAFAMRSPDELEREISARKDAEQRLLEVNVNLERRVSERTEELHRSVIALEAERERLRTTLASIGDAVISTDVEGRVTNMNSLAEALTGWTTEDALGQPLNVVFNIVNEKTRQQVENPASSALKDGVRVGLANHTMLIAKDGTERPIDDSAAPIKRITGEIAGCVLVFRDITERRRQEAILQESERQLRLLADTIPQLTWMARPDGHIFWFNRRWYEYTGTTPAEMEGWGWQSVHKPEVLPKVLERWRWSLASGEPFDMVFPLKGADGQFRPHLTRVNPLTNDEGKITFWFGTNTDIAELHEAREALALSEERLQLALDAGRMGVWDWNIRSSDLEWSDSLEPLHGLAPGSFGGTFEHFQQLIHPEDREMVNAAIGKTLETGADFYVEFRNLRPNGGSHWIAGSGRVFRGEDGQPIRMIGIGLDVTRRKRSEQTARFLADASAALAVLVDFDSTLQKVSALAVPAFADWATVDLVEPDGSLRRVSVTHIDPAKVQLAHEVHRRFPPDPHALQGAWNIVRTGRSEIVSEITDELLKQSISDDELLGIMRQLGLKSYIGVPLKVRGNILGVITFINAESGHCYDDIDLAVAEDLAHRASIAIENANFYRSLRDDDQRKDEFLATLAHELRNPLVSKHRPFWAIRVAHCLTLVATASGTVVQVGSAPQSYEPAGEHDRATDFYFPYGRLGVSTSRIH